MRDARGMNEFTKESIDKNIDDFCESVYQEIEFNATNGYFNCKLKFQGLAKPQDGSTYIYQETAKVVRIESVNNMLRVACKVSGKDAYYSTYVKVLKALKIL